MNKKNGNIVKLDIADGYLLTSEVNVAYTTGFTGDSSEFLSIGNQSYFFTDSRYTQQAEKDLDKNVQIITTGAPERLSAINKLLVASNVKRLAIEKENVTVALLEEFQKVFGDLVLLDISPQLLKMRAIKTPAELEKIEKAAAGNEIVLKELQKIIRIGMSELDLRAELLYCINKQGMDSAFTPIVAAGKNSALPHATVTDYKLQPGDFLTLDFGCKYQGYCSDITRTFGIGDVDAKQKSIYDIVRQAQQAALDVACVGMSTKNIDMAARSVIEKKGYGSYYQHGTGHGVGLQIHELPVLNPRSDELLEPNMVYTIEPGIYIPGMGGVRIEDMCIAGRGNLYGFSKELNLIQ